MIDFKRMSFLKRAIATAGKEYQRNPNECTKVLYDAFLENYGTEYDRLKAELAEQMHLIHDIKTATVMRYCYLDGMTTPEIAEKYFYSDRHIRRILAEGKRIINKAP